MRGLILRQTVNFADFEEIAQLWVLHHCEAHNQRDPVIVELKLTAFLTYRLIETNVFINRLTAVRIATT